MTSKNEHTQISHKNLPSDIPKSEKIETQEHRIRLGKRGRTYRALHRTRGKTIQRKRDQTTIRTELDTLDFLGVISNV